MSSNNMAVVRFVSDGDNALSGFKVTFTSDFACELLNMKHLTNSENEGAYSTNDADKTTCISDCENDVKCMALTFDTKCTLFSSIPKLVQSDLASSLFYMKTCPGHSGNKVLPNIPVIDRYLAATETRKQLMSPLYPFMTVGGQSYYWTLTAPGRQLVILEFLDLDLGPEDELIIYDGNDLSSSKLMTLTSKSTLTQPVYSSGNSLTLFFSSWNFSKSRGFLLTYKKGCELTLTSNVGEFYSPGFGLHNYPNVLDCKWTIQATDQRPLRLTFSSFDLAANDFLKIFIDGSKTAIHSDTGYSGNTRPADVVSSSGKITLQMTTSAFGSATGFKASYVTGCTRLETASRQSNPNTQIFPGSKVTITCKQNFKFSGVATGSSKELTCGENGDWLEPVPECISIICGEATTVQNGYLSNSSGVFIDDKLSYSCDTGYQPSGSDVTCQNDGSWQPTPFCLSISQCPSLAQGLDIQKKTVLGNGIAYGSIVEFKCTKSDHEIVGSPSIMCGLGGTWSDNAPSCQARQCEVPFIENAQTFPSDVTEWNQLITVTCNTGYTIQGPTSFRCGTDIDIPKCENIDECANGAAGCAQSCNDTNGSYVCSCGQGYKLSSNKISCGDYNECNVDNGGCADRCTNLFGSYSCSCSSGNGVLYEKDGQFGLFLPDGEDGSKFWHRYHIGHSCVHRQNHCPDLPRTVTNGILLSDAEKHFIGAAVKYVCDLGFTISGADELVCLSTATWSAEVPSCVAAQCDTVTSSTMTITPTTKIDFLQYYTGTCNVKGIGNVEVKTLCTYDNISKSYRADDTKLQCPSEPDCGDPKPIPGATTFTPPSTTLGSAFQFSCRGNFRLEGASSTGSSIVTCQSNGFWDFNTLRCYDPKCSDPGTALGATQISSSYEEYSLVSYHCQRRGFEPETKWPLLCEWNAGFAKLQWNTTRPQCIDTEAPKFSTCSGRLDIVIPQLTSPSSLGFTDPHPQDNDKVKTFTIDSSQFAMHQILTSPKTVTYEAIDDSGNTNICTVDIQIKDETPPKIECIQPFIVTLQVPSDIKTYTVLDMYKRGSATDDSGTVPEVTMEPEVLSVDKSHVGEVLTVRVTATDSSGNIDVCYVQVSVTAPKCVEGYLYVENANIDCTSTGSRLECTVQCASGFVLASDKTKTSVLMSCDSGKDWDAEKPICVATRALTYRKVFTLRYLATSNTPTACESSYRQQIINKINKISSNLNNLCSVTNPVTSVTFSEGAPIVELTASELLVTVTLDITTDSGLSTSETNLAVDQCSNAIESSIQNMDENFEPIKSLPSDGECSELSDLAPKVTGSEQNGISCSNNEELLTESGSAICVQCPPGTTSDRGGQCSDCPKGQYFSNVYHRCHICPDDADSQTEGAKSEMDCYLSCPKGYTSSNERFPCQICPKDSYRETPKKCVSCVGDTFTSKDGENEASACREVCPIGQYSVNGLKDVNGQCLKCPRGFYNDQVNKLTCQECSSHQTTTSVGATSLTDCVDAYDIECVQSNPCQNGGTCSVANHVYFCQCAKGYFGTNCENEEDPCESSPCYHGGQCQKINPTSFECDCPASTSGDRCETITTNYCDGVDCGNFGACKTLFDKYECLCPSYSQYTNSDDIDRKCTKLRDPCSDSPCQNDGVCSGFGSTRRLCDCPEGYTGDACETEIDKCNPNPCKYNGVCTQTLPGSMVCACADGYSGDFCEERVDRCASTSCPSFSDCVDDFVDWDLVCVCREGYQKTDDGQCILVEKKPCFLNPCKNDGVCVPNEEEYTCDCLDYTKYEGFNCQHNIDDCDPNPCLNGAECVDLDPVPDSGLRYKCLCPNDTKGSICEDAVDACGPTNPCNTTGGACVDLYQSYRCDCYPGFHGDRCQMRSGVLCDSFPCRHGGTCTETGTVYNCSCTDGYRGTNCEEVITHCDATTCKNNGVCFDYHDGYRCRCPYGYRGDSCEIKSDKCLVANPCQNDGECTDLQGIVSCACKKGFGGHFCQSQVKTCLSKYCSDSGICSEVDGKRDCQCDKGFSGEFCETNINECESVTCSSGFVCVDGLASSTCVCVGDRLGKDCSKSPPADFDIVFTGSAIHQSQDFRKLVQALDQSGSGTADPGSSSSTTFDPTTPSGLSLVTWLRFTGVRKGSSRRKRATDSQKDIILSLYEMSSVQDDSPALLLQLHQDSLSINSNGLMTQDFDRDISNGYWHHLAVVWDSNTEVVDLYIDGQSVDTFSNVTIQRPDFFLLVLSGSYDSTLDSVDQSHGFIGRLSKIHVTPTALTDSDITEIFQKRTEPSNSIKSLTKAILLGAVGIIDYQSQLTNKFCLTGENCRTMEQILDFPEFTYCPDDQNKVSERVSQPSWIPATVDQGDNTQLSSNYQAGQTMGWGTYGIVYANQDKDGNVAICTFLFYNRRTSCVTPKNQAYCSVFAPNTRCSIACPPNSKPSENVPKYQSCGVYGIFDSDDRILDFEFPSCIPCSSPIYKYTVDIGFLFDNLFECTDVNKREIQETLNSNITTAIENLKINWPTLCTPNCSNLDVVTSCSKNRIAAVLDFSEIEDPILKIDGSTQNTLEDILLRAVVDENIFSFYNVRPEKTSMSIQKVAGCESNSVLVGDCCVTCGPGHFYDNSSGKCKACPKGSYSIAIDASTSGTCQSCPGGETTATEGCGSVDKCHTACNAGNYFNLSEDKCSSCQIGYFSETVGTFYCDACDFQQTTANTGSVARTLCSTNSETTTTSSTITSDSGASPSVGASTDNNENEDIQTALIVVAVVLLIIIIVILVLCCCFRAWLERICPCLAMKVMPDEPSKFHYANRYGETNLKYAKYNMKDANDSEEDSLGASFSSPPANLQVPIFEETLNGRVTKKSVHIADQDDEMPEMRRKNKKHYDLAGKDSMPANLPPLSAPSAAPPLDTDGLAAPKVRRPPSAFSKPKPSLDQVPFNEFVGRSEVSNQTAGLSRSDKVPQSEQDQGDSDFRITLDSDDDMR